MKNRIAVALAVLFLGLGITPVAKADIYLEPYLGYLTGKLKAAENEDANGMQLGARVGYGLLGFAAGLEYEAGSLTAPGITIKPSNLGAFVSYQFPILVRAYAGYSPIAKGSTKGTTFEGSAMKLGVGYSGLPFVVINFEINNTTYTEDSDGDLGRDIKMEMYGVNISIPFNL